MCEWLHFLETACTATIATWGVAGDGLRHQAGAMVCQCHADSSDTVKGHQLTHMSTSTLHCQPVPSWCCRAQDTQQAPKSDAGN